MQGRIGHRDAADKHRLKPRNRRDSPGASDLHLNGFDYGQLFLGRELVRHRPARLPGAKAQLPLPVQPVDLVHHAINVEGKRIAFGGNRVVKGDQARRSLRHPPLAADRQAESGQGVQQPTLGRGQFPALNFAQTISEKGERPFGRLGRIELANAARRAVAGIDQRRQSGGALPGVVAFKVGMAHVRLAAHFQHFRRGALQAQRHGLDGSHILRHVFAGLAITSGRGLGQPPALITQANRQTIKLEFAAVFDRRGLVV